MAQDIYDPLNEYIKIFRGRFKDVAHTTFAQLAAEAQVDVEANRETCRQLRDIEEDISTVRGNTSWWKFFRVVLWIGVVAGVIASFVEYNDSVKSIDAKWTMAAYVAGIFVALLLLLLWINPKISKLNDECSDLEDYASELRNTAWKQMEPLNSLYDWDVLTRMMVKTVPKLEFDPYFTTQRLADLKRVYGWNENFNSDRSVVYSHSGLINGNPFVICRTRKMEMGEMTYEGRKTIHWTTRECDSNGKYYTAHHSEVLTATVTAPYPQYFEKTWVIYGNTAAPDLIFYRAKSGLASRVGSMAYKKKLRSLRKKARDLSNADFAMMTNEEFETVFDSSNRNNNQQYALLFTPLAQENMLNLLKDTEGGYGDDFDFSKHMMINTIISNHMQSLNLDMNPEQYKNFDYEKAERDFYELNSGYFRAIYFALAPLLCIPMYQQIRPQEDIYGRDMPRHSSFWEHEALANFWGYERFMHPNCATNCILKTEQKESQDDKSTIVVYAYGYSKHERLTYVRKYGGDGRWHKVPVYWYEYQPIMGQGKMAIVEDNGNEVDVAESQTQRINHIKKILSKENLKCYRRHIASKV
ncbi:MAG: MAG1210 family protein [Muribaculaceae bacterium]